MLRLFLSGSALRGRDDLAGATFGFDFGAGRSAEGVGTDSELFAQFAVAEDLDTGGTTVGEASGGESSGVNASAIVEPVEGLKIDREVADGVAGVIEPAFGNAADEGHLTTLEADPDRAAGASGLAFATATTGFTVATGFTLAEPFASVLGAGTRFKVV